MGQTYRYIKENSIIYNQVDDYVLSLEEFFLLYSFFVTYSVCENQSAKRRSFEDYGWKNGNIQTTVNNSKVVTPLGKALNEVLNFSVNKNFLFTDEDNLRELYRKNDLVDGVLTDLDKERAVIAKTNGSNKYLKLFYRIRNGLAHGRFIFKFSSTNEKMVIIQDNNRSNVTARIVIKLSTLLCFVKAVDLDNIILGQNGKNSN